jgi:Fungal specific transcription factor domain/Fungal Zn(2)-Cys(6) binuclear cluster domain
MVCSLGIETSVEGSAYGPERKKKKKTWCNGTCPSSNTDMTTIANDYNVFSLIIAPCSNCAQKHVQCDGMQPSCSTCLKDICNCMYKSRANVELGDRERAERINSRIHNLINNIFSLTRPRQNPVLQIQNQSSQQPTAEAVKQLQVSSSNHDSASMPAPSEQSTIIKKEKDDLPFKLPAGWRLIAQGGGLSMETNIHTLGELYNTLQAIRQELFYEGSPPISKNLGDPQFRPTRSRMGGPAAVDRLTLRRQYGYYITSPDSSLNPAKRNSGNQLSRYPPEVLDRLIQLHLNCTSHCPVDKQAYLWRYRERKLPRPLTYAIYACAALHAYRCHPEFDHLDYLEDLAEKSYTLARDLVNFDEMRMITIETLMVMQYYKAGCGQLREAYSIFGTAVRMAHALHLYENCNNPHATPQDRENSRRLWAWIAWFDMSYVIFSGYVPMLCDDKTRLLQLTAQPTDDESARDFIESRSLIIQGLQNGVRYALSKDEDNDGWELGIPSPRAMKLLDDLHRWRASLKPTFEVPELSPTLEGGNGHPKYTTRHRHLYLKHAQYYIFLLVIHKPFVKSLQPESAVSSIDDDDVEDESSFSFEKHALDICTTGKLRWHGVIKNQVTLSGWY